MKIFQGVVGLLVITISILGADVVKTNKTYKVTQLPAEPGIPPGVHTPPVLVEEVEEIVIDHVPDEEIAFPFLSQTNIISNMPISKWSTNVTPNRKFTNAVPFTYLLTQGTPPAFAHIVLLFDSYPKKAYSVQVCPYSYFESPWEEELLISNTGKRARKETYVMDVYAISNVIQWPGVRIMSNKKP